MIRFTASGFEGSGEDEFTYGCTLICDGWVVGLAYYNEHERKLSEGYAYYEDYSRLGFWDGVDEIIRKMGGRFPRMCSGPTAWSSRWTIRSAFSSRC